MTDRWYPKEWRDRYGDDLNAYLEDEYGGGRLPLAVRASLLAGGLRQRARYSGLIRGRASAADQLRAATLVVLCGWVALVIGGASFAKLSEHFDEALPHQYGPHRVPDAAYTVVQNVAGGAAVIVLTGLALAMPALIRFLRNGGWPTLRRPVARALVVTAIAAAATGAVILWAHHLDSHGRNGGAASYRGLFAAWAVLVVADLGLWTSVAITAAGRVTFASRVLKAEAALALVVSAATAGIVVAAGLWVTVMTQRAPGFITDGGSVVLDLQLDVTAFVMLAATLVTTAGAIRIVRSWRALGA